MEKPKPAATPAVHQTGDRRIRERLALLDQLAGAPVQKSHLEMRSALRSASRSLRMTAARMRSMFTDEPIVETVPPLKGRI